NEIAKPQQRKRDPDPLVAPGTAKTIGQRTPHWIEKHHQRIATAEPQQAIQPVKAGHASPHLSKNESGYIGVVEYLSIGDHLVAPIPVLRHLPSESAPSADKTASKRTNRARRRLRPEPGPSNGCRSYCNCYRP